MRKLLAAPLLLLLLAGGVMVGTAEAHSATLERTCLSVTLKNDNSDGTLHVLSQTGGAFAVGDSIPSHDELTRVATPNTAYSVTVNWSTDSTHRTYSVGAMENCVTVTTTTSPPLTTSPSTPPTSKVNQSSSTSSTKKANTPTTPNNQTDIDTPIIVTATPAFTG